MKGIEVKDGQNIWDLALQEAGSLEAAFHLIKDNELEVDGNLNSGDPITVSAEVEDFDIPVFVRPQIDGIPEPILAKDGDDLFSFCTRELGSLEALFLVAGDNTLELDDALSSGLKMTVSEEAQSLRPEAARTEEAQKSKSKVLQLSGQSIWDLAIQEAGSIQKALELVERNGFEVDEKLKVGMSVISPDPESIETVRNLFKRGLKPNTWIEEDFISSSYPFDAWNFTGEMIGGFSIRKMSKDVSGIWGRVMRDSDNAELDIPWLESGYVDSKTAYDFMTAGGDTHLRAVRIYWNTKGQGNGADGTIEKYYWQGFNGVNSSAIRFFPDPNDPRESYFEAVTGERMDTIREGDNKRFIWNTLVTGKVAADFDPTPSTGHCNCRNSPWLRLVFQAVKRDAASMSWQQGNNYVCGSVSGGDYYQLRPNNSAGDYGGNPIFSSGGPFNVNQSRPYFQTIVGGTTYYLTPYNHNNGDHPAFIGGTGTLYPYTYDVDRWFENFISVASLDQNCPPTDELLTNSDYSQQSGYYDRYQEHNYNRNQALRGGYSSPPQQFGAYVNNTPKNFKLKEFYLGIDLPAGNYSQAGAFDFADSRQTGWMGFDPSVENENESGRVDLLQKIFLDHHDFLNLGKSPLGSAYRGPEPISPDPWNDADV